MILVPPEKYMIEIFLFLDNAHTGILAQQKTPDKCRVLIQVFIGCTELVTVRGAQGKCHEVYSEHDE